MRMRRCFVQFFCAASLMVGLADAQVPIGTPLPDVTVYRADGQAFSLSELKGTYSVLVFGCLT